MLPWQGLLLDACLRAPQTADVGHNDGKDKLLCRYIQAFQSGFDEGLKEVQLSFMQSDGGLSPVSSICGHKAVLSGPAGG